MGSQEYFFHYTSEPFKRLRVKPLLNPHSIDNLYITSEGSDSLRTSEAVLHDCF